MRKLLLAAVSAAKRMGQAFSDDLRRRILQTYERENISQPALAQRIGVSYDYVKKIRKQQLRSGQRGAYPAVPSRPCQPGDGGGATAAPGGSASASRCDAAGAARAHSEGQRRGTEPIVTRAVAAKAGVEA